VWLLVTESDAAVIERVLVIGAGRMGSGIAQIVAESGLQTTLFDVDVSNLERGMSAIDSRWQRQIAIGRKIEDDVNRARAQLAAGSLDNAVNADLVIEAVYENLEAKTALFTALAGIAPGKTIFASNTSSLSITALGRASGRPDRFVGLHFFNPVPVLPLVEVIRGLATSDETVEKVTAFAASIGKTPVVVNDAPGFVANRIALPMINEAVFALEEGVAPKEAIDEIMKLGLTHPMGPLALADLIGLDVCLDILETLHHDFGDDKYRPAPLLRRMVAAGRLGRKSGAGFYTY
jgi:3-hydroxybutyryl-CoA dehydrogenase